MAKFLVSFAVESSNCTVSRPNYTKVSKLFSFVADGGGDIGLYHKTITIVNDNCK